MTRLLQTGLTRILALSALCLTAVLPLAAQNLKVVDCKPVGTVLHGKQIRTDVNGAEAAVVKVLLPVPGVTFDGNLIGEAEYYSSEYWVWLEGDAAGSGTAMFDVRCPGAPTLHVDFTDFGIPLLKSKGVYELTLDIPRDLLYGRTAAPADLGGDYFVLTVAPKENVMVKIDGIAKATRGGQLNEFLTYGDHTYTIDSPGYITETGTVTLTRGGGKVERDITLRSAMGTLTITSETPGAVISVNGQLRGAGSWSAPMIAGNYQIEATLDGYRPYNTTLVMSEGENKSITIPSLDPIYAALQVDYYPSKSQVSIDGKPVGETPLALNNLTAGSHILEITADGYQPHRQQITLSEASPLRLSGELTVRPHSTLEEANQYYDNKEYDKAVPIYRELAEQGNSEAQYKLGYCYNGGRGVPKSSGEAAKWYRKSAEQGNAEAQNSLGDCYAYGDGVMSSYAEAVKWWRKSAEQGNSWGQYHLGWSYVRGEGVEQSYAEAAKWYQKSAEQGHAGAQSRLGLCYYNGQGVPQSYTEAVKWWRKSAEQDETRPKFWLGLCYYYGQGVMQSYAEAAQWFRKGAESWLGGDSDAKYYLGLCYWKGEGVPKDAAEAVKWWRLSAKDGNQYAKESLKKFGYSE